MVWAGALIDTGWINVGSAGAPAFQNSWANYGGGYVVARYRRLNGLVHLQMAVQGGGAGTTVFTLPAGFRPSATLSPAPGGGNTSSVVITSGGAIVGTAASGQLAILTSFPVEA